MTTRTTETENGRTTYTLDDEGHVTAATCRHPDGTETEATDPDEARDWAEADGLDLDQ